MERLADSTGNRIQNVGVRIHSSGQAPHDVIHRIDIDVGVCRNREPHSLIACENRRQEIPLPAFFDLVPLLDLNNASAPVRHAERNIHVLNDARLQPLA